MSFILSDVNTVTQITITPQARGYRDDASLIRNLDRSHEGQLKSYVFGSYERRKIPISFISSADATAINSFWLANTKVLITATSYSGELIGYLSNKRLPINQHVEGRYDLYRGVIEVEEA